MRAIDENTSILGYKVLPIAHHHFDLSVVKFQVALALRYHTPLLKMPEVLDVMTPLLFVIEGIGYYAMSQ